MADIPDEIHSPTRDEVVTDAKNSYVVRSMEANPDKAVDVGEGTFPAVLAEVVGDLAMPHYANAVTSAKRWLVANVFGADLERLALEKLGPEDGVRRTAYGASGYVEATKIEVGGMHADTTTTLTDTKTGLRFRVVTEQDYADGDPIAIIGIDTGPATNLDAGTVLQFDSPPPGCSLTATVLAQNDGTGTLVGLTGGRDAETDVELQKRITDAAANPPAAGNDAQIVQVAQKTTGVPVQKAWTIPAWFGPGSTCVPFTLRPDASTSRIPNSVQRGLVEADLKSVFPRDWTITVPAVLTQSLSISVGVSWLSSARGWTDLVPWPPYVPGDPVVVSAVSSSLSLTATTGTTTTAPVAGQTVALFALASKTWKRKRIASVTTLVAGKSWTLTFTDALGASDSFVPAVGALISPFSASLARLVPPVVAYTQTLGPGEMFASLPDPGGRRRRWPFSPDEWPSTVTNEGLVNAVKASGAIGDVEVLSPATPYATTVGTPGVSVYLLQFSDFAVYPQT
jgi:hypothetical protein